MRRKTYNKKICRDGPVNDIPCKNNHRIWVNNVNFYAIITKHRDMPNGSVAEFAYATDLKSVAFGLGGSSPPAPTNILCY